MKLINSAIKLIEKGEYDKAEELLLKAQDNSKKYNLLGLIQFNKNNFEETEKLFKKSLKLNPIDDDTLFNYGYLLNLKNNYLDAWRYLMRIHQKDWAVYDILGDIETNNRSKSLGLKYYTIASSLAPNPSMSEKLEMAKKTFYKNIKIAFLCLPSLETFIKPIYENLSYIYDTRLIISNNGEELKKAAEWADIIWLEWGNEVANFVTNNVDLKNKKVICRIHGYEVFTDIPKQIKWMLLIMFSL
ncbi:tetratricopeptide repeat protein [Marinitoga lauensis]|uniref:tetratricopeptide repeat protein n=1 Tax=Marinitoga lauensis TaxID=2201189 RepID=UPI00101395A4|nr:hypothetical protein [Marinitoga lauensis]